MSDYADGDYIYDTHWLAMKRAVAGNGVVQGLQVTPNNDVPAQYRIQVAPGVWYANGIRKQTLLPTIIQLLPPDIGLPRWDIITGDQDGNLNLWSGIADAIPKPRELPDNEILVCAIFMPFGTWLPPVLQDYIRDFDFRTQYLEHSPRHETGGDDEIDVTGLSGVLPEEQPSSWAQVSGKPTEFNPTPHAIESDRHTNSGLLGDMPLSDGAGGVTWETINPLKFRGVLIGASTIWQLPAVSIWVDLVWGTETIDTDSFYTGPETAIITIPVNGIYEINAKMLFSANNNGDVFQMDIEKNGTTQIFLMETTGFGSFLEYGFTAVVQLTAGDTIKIRFFTMNTSMPSRKGQSLYISKVG